MVMESLDIDKLRRTLSVPCNGTPVFIIAKLIIPGKGCVHSVIMEQT